jgi:hypothetical protein
MSIARWIGLAFQAYCPTCKRFTEHDDRARGMRCTEHRPTNHEGRNPRWAC